MQPALHVASKTDANRIADMVNRAYRPSSLERGWTHEADLVAGERTTSEQVLSLFSPRSLVLVLCQGAAIVACVHLQNDDSEVYIGMLATEPSLQTQGLGKTMLSHAEQYAITHFNATVFRMSVLSSRTELIAFYERRGYARTGEVKAYPISAGVGLPLVEGLQVEALVKRLADSQFFLSAAQNT
jgi:ribosomal protein S18 acetylase RimI-like enzyme